MLNLSKDCVKEIGEELLTNKDLRNEIILAVKSEHQFAFYEDRRQLLENWLNNGKFDAIVEKFRKIYCKSYVNHCGDKDKKSRYLALQKEFWAVVSDVVAGKDISDLQGQASPRSTSACIHAIAQATFNGSQKVIIANIKSGLKNGQEKIESVLKKRPDEATQFLMGGGTMGQMKRLYRRQYHTLKKELGKEGPLNVVLMKLRLITAFKMAWNEKKRLAPIYLQCLDRGFLYIPKANFLVFISELANCVQVHSNETVFTIEGEKMVKETWAAVSEQRNYLWALFEHAAKEHIWEFKGPDRKVAKSIFPEFFSVWLRKMTHALISKNFRSHAQTLAELKGKRLKGGQNLRQQLY